MSSSLSMNIVEGSFWKNDLNILFLQTAIVIIDYIPLRYAYFVSCYLNC